LESKQNKKRRNEGLSYVHMYGTLFRKRMLKAACGVSCRFRCSKQLSEEDRKNLLHSYWQLGCVTRQRQFIISNTNKCEKSRGRKN
jgi:hypothetical protein